MKKNDEFEIEITGMSSSGSGVGKIDSLAVFVPLTVMGDIAKIKIVKMKKSYAFGKLLSLIKPAPSRQNSDCPVFERCGGCVYRHISYEEECRIKYEKVRDAINRIGGIDLIPEPILADNNINGYRNKAQYPISETGEVGFYAPHSHRIIECDNCRLQPEIFSLIAKILTNWIRKYNIPVYNEKNHSGLLRHLYLRRASATGEIMVVLVINGQSVPHSAELINALKETVGEDLKSIQLNINTQKTNVILGNTCRVLYGQDTISDILCGVKIQISPLSFYQVNRDMAERLYEKAAEYAEPCGKHILDLYCGAGTIGLSLANKAAFVTGVEIIPEAVEDAVLNAHNNGIKNARFLCSDAAKAAEQLKDEGIKPDVVIVDPPRKGCEAALLKTVAKDFSPERIVYVSCDPATLARDCAILKDYGYIMKSCTPVDMFPRTSHVETVALLSRQKVNEYINFDVDVANLPKTTRTTATYPEIKAYIKDKYGLCVSSLNIAQVKEKHGLEKRENYNKGKEDHRVPNCTPEKEKAIESAFKHFGMI